MKTEKQTQMETIRPRVIVLTDISSMQSGVLEPDDTESMVRFLLYSNEFDVEGLIATSYGPHGTKPEYIRQLICAYGKIRENLAKHDDRYPAAEQLLAVTKEGSGHVGMEYLGEKNDTPGSRLIIEAADKEDSRPLWILLWGGPLDLAQAIWRVCHDRTPEEAAAFKSRLRVYAIGDQYDGTGPWIKQNHPDIFYITNYAAFRGMYRYGNPSLTSEAWVKNHVSCGHGPLGALYPVYNGGDPWGAVTGMKEGDTPSFLYLIPAHGHDPEDPTGESWGGQFRSVGERQYQDVPSGWKKTNDPDEIRIYAETVAKWRPEFQADFAERLSWCLSPLDYAKASVETMMRRWNAAELPPTGHFHYHQGVFLSGVYQTYELCGDERYFQYMKDWVDSCIGPDGKLKLFDPGQLDDIQPGILLYPLLERTGDAKYQNILEELAELLLHFTKNKDGGFWHKDCFPDQMWLDGLYMAGPFASEYGFRMNQPGFFDLVAEQVLLMREKTQDPKTGLLYHAYDASRRESWSDPETGHSAWFWGRSIGWVPVAILNDLDFFPADHPKRAQMEAFAAELLKNLCRYQSEDGRWYQVVDQGGREGNWLENSCSCLYAAAIAKAVRKGVLPAEYLSYAKKGYDGVIRSLDWEAENLLVGNVCIGTGVGDYDYYCSRPVSVNDLHGVGAFLILCTEIARI